MSETMVIEALPVGTAQLKLGLLNAQAAAMNKLDVITRFTNKGLPQELVTRLEWLWEETKVVAGEVIQVGKIILLKIWEWVERNPHMVIGMAIGAAVGSLVSLIPFIGPFLAPIGAALGFAIGGIAGTRLDKKLDGQMVGQGGMQLAEDVITMAKEFFKLLAAIFLGLKEYFIG
jgi:hypothetical protein